MKGWVIWSKDQRIITIISFCSLFKLDLFCNVIRNGGGHPRLHDWSKSYTMDMW